jgi:hypothetical protein
MSMDCESIVKEQGGSDISSIYWFQCFQLYTQMWDWCLMVTVFSSFWGASILFSIMPAPFYISIKCSKAPISLSLTILVIFFKT